MRFYLIALIIGSVILAGCAQNKEVLLTAERYCTHLEDQQDPGNMRDKHDECILFKKEELSNKDECKIICDVHCGEIDGAYVSSFADFSGCHCTCNTQ